MMARFVSGLDWSGDSGDPRRTPGKSPLLVLAIAHLAVADWELLEASIARVRIRRWLPADFAFHFHRMSLQVREAMFDELVAIPDHAHALVIDKRLWSRNHVSRTRGDDRLQTSIVELICRCPDDLVANQDLLIDYPKAENAKIIEIKRNLKRALAAHGRTSFRAVKPAPDTGATGALIQVADVIAGALQDAPNRGPPYLHRLRERITLV
jgi:hypothetical protein